MDQVTNLAVRIIPVHGLFIALVTERAGSVAKLDAVEAKIVDALKRTAILNMPVGVGCGSGYSPQSAAISAMDDYERRVGFG